MPSATTSRTGGRSERVRQAVLTATRALLAERGLAGLRIEHVAERAGVNKTSIYRRWGDRRGLVAAALLDRSASTILVPDTGELRGDLLALARSVAAALGGDEGRTLVAALGSVTTDPDLVGVSQDFWAARRQAHDAIVQRAIARGELASSTCASHLVDALAGPLWFRAFVTGEVIDEAFLSCLVDSVVGGLRAASPA